MSKRKADIKLQHYTILVFSWYSESTVTLHNHCLCPLSLEFVFIQCWVLNLRLRLCLIPFLFVPFFLSHLFFIFYCSFSFLFFFIYFSFFPPFSALRPVPLLLLFVHFLTSCSHQGLVARSNLYSRPINSRELRQLLAEEQNPLKLPGNAPFEPQSTIYHGAPLSVTMVLRKPH